MMINDKSLKFKLTLGYLILIVTAIFSIWYIFSEIEKINTPKQELLRENNRIFDIGSTINNIYATESLARIALITANSKDVEKYKTQIDSVTTQLDAFKKNIEEPSVKIKIDTIQYLIAQKNKSFNEIISLKRKYLNSQNFDKAFEKFRNEKNKLDENIKITEEVTTAEKKTFMTRFKESFSSKAEEEQIAQNEKERQKEREKRAILDQKHKTKRDSLAKAAEKIFNEAIKKESKLQNEFYSKEESLLFENKNITEEIKLLLTEIEQSVIRNSSNKIQFSKQIIDKTAMNLAIVGSISFVMVILLGGIVVRDLNKNHDYKLKLESMNDNMEHLIRQKTMFFATVTHDIISPLNTLVGFTELLEKTIQTPKQKSYIKNIKYSTNYIQNLASDLVDFSKLEYNKIIIKTDLFNFKELIESIFEPLKETAKQKNIDLKYQVEPVLNDTFASDSYRIKQILTNIATNAIKFTKEGSVTIHAGQEKENIKITIKDTGIGIDKKYHDDIFKEFRQAHGDIEKIYGGTGLGLNITKRLVELLDGKIEFESEVDKGTIFTIYLPILKGFEHNNIKDGVVFDSEKKLSRKNILVIDDDNLQLQLMKEILKDKVNSVTLLNNGVNITEVLQENKFNLIITDIQMPNFNGYQIIEKIRSNPLYKDIPVIAFTGKIELEENEYLKLGFNALLKKPIKTDKLILEINKLLKINVLHEEVTKISIKSYDFKNFNIDEILSFTQNDTEATTKILNLFISSTHENLSDLEKAVVAYDLEKISNVAHKMLPMFKQLQMVNLVSKLIKLEREPNTIPKNDIVGYFSILKMETEKILVQIKNIEL